MKRIGKNVVLVLAGVLVAALCSGCLGANSQADETAQKVRNYMSQVNQIMVDLDEGLAGFTDAVSRDDAVNMDNQLAQAMKTLDKLDALEAPDVLKDVQQSYKEACATLKGAVQDYVDVYQEASAAGATADWNAYADRLATIQASYDKGIAALEQADAAAAKVAAEVSKDTAGTIAAGGDTSAAATSTSATAAQMTATDTSAAVQP